MLKNCRADIGYMHGWLSPPPRALWTTAARANASQERAVLIQESAAIGDDDTLPSLPQRLQIHETQLAAHLKLHTISAALLPLYASFSEGQKRRLTILPTASRGCSRSAKASANSASNPTERSHRRTGFECLAAERVFQCRALVIHPPVPTAPWHACVRAPMQADA